MTTTTDITAAYLTNGHDTGWTIRADHGLGIADDPIIGRIWWDGQDPHAQGLILALHRRAALDAEWLPDSGAETASVLAERGWRLDAADVARLDALIAEEAR